MSAIEVLICLFVSGVIGCGYFCSSRFSDEVVELTNLLVPATRVLWQQTKVSTKWGSWIHGIRINWKSVFYLQFTGGTTTAACHKISKDQLKISFIYNLLEGQPLLHATKFLRINWKSISYQQFAGGTTPPACLKISQLSGQKKYRFSQIGRSWVPMIDISLSFAQNHRYHMLHITDYGAIWLRRTWSFSVPNYYLNQCCDLLSIGTDLLSVHQIKWKCHLQNTVECRYNVVQFITISLTTLEDSSKT